MSLTHLHGATKLSQVHPLGKRAQLFFTQARRETVRKGFLREWLGTLPSMRKAYQTDLSDAEWSYVEPHFPTPKAPGRPRLHTPREIL